MSELYYSTRTKSKCNYVTVFSCCYYHILECQHCQMGGGGFFRIVSIESIFGIVSMYSTSGLWHIYHCQHFGNILAYTVGHEAIFSVVSMWDVVTTISM
jgi:hypothetical protein